LNVSDFPVAIGVGNEERRKESKRGEGQKWENESKAY